MRERHNLEKKQLPESVYELWLHSQTVSKQGNRHRSPAQDIYEAWMKKEVAEMVGKSGANRLHGHRKGY